MDQYVPSLGADYRTKSALKQPLCVDSKPLLSFHLPSASTNLQPGPSRRVEKAAVEVGLTYQLGLVWKGCMVMLDIVVVVNQSRPSNVIVAVCLAIGDFFCAFYILFR